MITLQELKKRISKKLESSVLSSKILKSRFKVGNDRPVALFSDPTYMPFYYHLGRVLSTSKKLIEFGFDLGMPSGCFFQGCPGVEHFLAFRKDSEHFFAKRLGISNIHNILKKKFDLWIGKESDPEFIKAVLLHKWDCAIISDEKQKETTYRSYLDLIWNQMTDGGVIVMDHLNETAVKEAFVKFCKLQSREPVFIETLRGTGILQK
jgi:hypothetical protein